MNVADGKEVYFEMVSDIVFNIQFYSHPKVTAYLNKLNYSIRNSGLAQTS